MSPTTRSLVVHSTTEVMSRLKLLDSFESLPHYCGARSPTHSAARVMHLSVTPHPRAVQCGTSMQAQAGKHTQTYTHINRAGGWASKHKQSRASTGDLVIGKLSAFSLSLSLRDDLSVSNRMFSACMLSPRLSWRSTLGVADHKESRRSQYH